MFPFICRGKRHLLVRPLLLLLLLLAVLLGCGEEEKRPEIIRSIRWMKVSETSATQVRMISGVVKAVDETYLSFAVSGTVEDVKVRLGDRVNKGAVLARLDEQPFVLAVRNAEADLKKAEARVIERRANYERTSALYESNNASKAELDEARAGYDSAQSQVKAAMAQLGLARRDLAKTALTAPFTGVISMKEIEPFVEIQAGKPIFELDGEEGGFEVALAVPERLILHLSPGQKTEVVFPTLKNRKAAGVVTEVGSRSQTANTYPARVQIRERFAEVRSGMSVEVAFSFSPAGEDGEPLPAGVKVPLTAILAGQDNEKFVFVFDEQTSTVKKTSIKVGALRENDLIVESGIKAGEIIATAGAQFLADGQQVKLMEQGGTQ